MISYVECLAGEGAGPGMTTRCWNSASDDERDELLPRKLAALQPKTEGSLRRRLLSAKIHQQHGAIYKDRKPLPPQYPGPWLHPQHLPHTFLPPEPPGKHHPVLVPRRQASLSPPAPESRLGYTRPPPPPQSATPPLREPEVPPRQYCYQPRSRRSLFRFRRWRGWSSRTGAVQTTPLLDRGTVVVESGSPGRTGPGSQWASFVRSSRKCPLVLFCPPPPFWFCCGLTG